MACLRALCIYFRLQLVHRVVCLRFSAFTMFWRLEYRPVNTRRLLFPFLRLRQLAFSLDFPMYLLCVVCVHLLRPGLCTDYLIFVVSVLCFA